MADGEEAPLEVPDDFDMESVWGVVLQHRLVDNKKSLQELIFTLHDGDPSVITTAAEDDMQTFLHIVCGLLQDEVYLQGESIMIFKGISGMKPAIVSGIINKDWFLLTVLRMLRDPPEDETITEMARILLNIVVHESSSCESFAWLCTEATLTLVLDNITNPFREASLALLELLMTACTELGPVALRSFVKIATNHENSRYFGETLLRVMNEFEIDSETPPPSGYRPALTIAAFIFSSVLTADFLYPADQKILLDVLLRHMECIPMEIEQEATWLAWVQCVGGIIVNSENYREDMHKPHAVLKALATVRDADDLPAECEPRRAARDVLTKTSALAEAEVVKYEGKGSEYG